MNQVATGAATLPRTTGLPAFAAFGRDICGDLEEAERREWWLANGLGGYAAGTLAGTLTRRYHGLLIAPVDPPLGRVLALAKADATVVDGDRLHPLFTNRWPGGLIDPLRRATIESFALEGRLPVWRFRIDETLVVEQRIWMEHGANTTYVAFRLVSPPCRRALALRLTLLVNARDHHASTQAGALQPGVAIDGSRLSVRHGDWFTLQLQLPGAHIEARRDWYQNFDLSAERERGLPDRDNHLCVGIATLDLREGEWVGLVASLHDKASADFDAALARARAHDLEQLALARERTTELRDAPAWVEQLVLAADSFVIARPLDAVPDGESVIAGYPWFGDWGRDTMIALPGLALATGRHETARRILRTFARFVDQGMLPNVFPGHGETPAYNSVDSGLWFIEAWRAYVAQTQDLEALREVFPLLQDMIDWHLRGTRYRIHQDPNDGLLFAGEPGVQLTWMDAKVGDWVVTPRIGKPVEINALWFNALSAMAQLAGRLGVPAAPYETLAANCRQGFQRFIDRASGGLLDVLDGPHGDDASLRPNQVFAVSLPFSPLAPADQARVVALLARRLLTPYGLRSLDADDLAYRPRYEGDVWQRDGAYHQGPVWAFLLGHYALAEYRVSGNAAAALQRLDGLCAHLRDAGLGTVSEIFDGAQPHRARGCPAQAWSVACTLEAWVRLERERRAHVTPTNPNPDDPPDLEPPMDPKLNAERQRLDAQHRGSEDWRLWGPYLAERAWGTVREDYSEYGNAWEYFDHDQARSRAYRWNEDGLAGVSDEAQRLCFALALWNGRDAILKERAFGLTGNQGNHGEDVKEYYFYVDATPSHSHLRYLYKYPQQAYPYAQLVAENARRTRHDAPFSLLDSGVFDDSRYWDVEVRYAKATPQQIHIRIVASNRGPETATLHLLPTLWFRNTWAWGDGNDKPRLHETAAPAGAEWAVRIEHPSLGAYRLCGQNPARALYTENDSNTQRLWGQPAATPYTKDAFHRHVIDGDTAAINPERRGTKFAAHHVVTVAPGETATLDLVLSPETLNAPFAGHEATFTERAAEAQVFYDELLPQGTPQDRNILRQALAGMIWSKQFFHFDVARWLDGDVVPPPQTHRAGRNHQWRHLKAAHVISMPDKWEYPWFAAWDLAFHCAALALVDVDFAKDQIELLLKEYYLHPNGQIPAYEWAFGDVNPPVLASAALKVFRAERVQRGRADTAFLQRVVNKLLMNFTWWLNRKDTDGHNVFEGGFLGLDNISVYDRSKPLPAGYSLKQADATGWMAMFAINMTVMCQELAALHSDYEDIAIQCYTQFLGIANSIAGHSGELSLWDDKDEFFKDLIVTPDGTSRHIDVFSWVGLIPLFAVEVVDERLLARTPRFRAVLEDHYQGVFDGRKVTHCPIQTNDRGEHLFSLVSPRRLKCILRRVLSEGEFMSRHGVRSVSRIHAERSDLGVLPGIGHAMIEYVPGESNSGLFGGNSNWRGPVWMPTNYQLVQAIEKYHRYYGDAFTVSVPCLGDARLNLKQIATLISERLVDMFRRDDSGRIPALPEDSPFHHDPHWQDLLLFHEYFHGETGLGLGAMHQSGWTGLVANLVQRKYRNDIPAYWRGQAAHGGGAAPAR